MKLGMNKVIEFNSYKTYSRIGKIMRIYKEYEKESNKHGILILTKINGIWLFDVTEMNKRRKLNKLKK